VFRCRFTPAGGKDVMQGNMKNRIILCLIFMVSMVVVAFAGQQSHDMQKIKKQMEGCACFIYSSLQTTEEKLIFMTNDLGAAATLGWINLGQGDIELAKVSYREDNKSIIFEFKGNGITLSFKGVIIEPATEEREYHVLKGDLLLKVGSKSKTIPVYAHSGC
jgi:hypothetical protein